MEGLKKVADGILPGKKQSLFPPDELKKILYNLIAWHDVGKSTAFFQYKIRKRILDDNQQCIIKREELNGYLSQNKKAGELLIAKDELGHHAHFGALAMLGAEGATEIDMDMLIRFHVIQKHHGNLGNFGTHLFCFDTDSPDDVNRMNIFKIQAENLHLEEFAETVNSFNARWSTEGYLSVLEKLTRQRKINNHITQLGEENTIKWFFKCVFLYSLLLSADKGDVMLADEKKEFEVITIPSSVIEDYKKKNLKDSNPVDALREQAYQTILSNLVQNPEQSFYSITLPTGLGKTFAALKAALILRENSTDHHCRIIYCLPFTSIIDQNANIVSQILKENGIPEKAVTVHHHLSENYKESLDEISFAETEYMVEGWQNEIMVTTFVQLWDSIFTNRNRQFRKFHNLVNSIIILDEVQNIPPKYIRAFEHVAEGLNKYFGTRFLFVTATPPVILPEKQTPLAVFGNENDYFFHRLNRIEIDLSLYAAGEIKLSELLKHVKDVLSSQSDASILFIFNTIRNSLEFYQLMKDVANEDSLFHLSAGHIPIRRIEILNAIRERLKAGKQVILVSTQVIEAGVDVDFNIVYRDFAPLDSINQAAGRCNRNGKRLKGKVFLFNSANNRYIQRIYDETLLDITKHLLQSCAKEIGEPAIAILNSQYFAEVKVKAQDTSSESPKILDHINKLQFEKLTEYPLIDDKMPRHNVYIPFTDDAVKLWSNYRDSFKITEPFKRRARLKSLLPLIQQYVVRIPKYIYKPSSDNADKFIIYESIWEPVYDMNSGFKLDSSKNSEAIVL